MKNPCADRKEQLLGTALGEQPAAELAAHLRDCSRCAAALVELRRRGEQLNRMLDLVVKDAEPAPDFRARVLSAAEQRRPRASVFRRWTIAGLAAACVGLAAWVTHLEIVQRNRVRLIPVEKITHWRAPSDVFLETPGRQNLRNGPRLGESIVGFVVTKKQED